MQLPWSKKIKVSGIAVAGVAQHDRDNGGTITVEIFTDGDREDQGTGQGPFAVASAAAWVP